MRGSSRCSPVAASASPSRWTTAPGAEAGSNRATRRQREGTIRQGLHVVGTALGTRSGGGTRHAWGLRFGPPPRSSSGSGRSGCHHVPPARLVDAAAFTSVREAWPPPFPRGRPRPLEEHVGGVFDEQRIDRRDHRISRPLTTPRDRMTAFLPWGKVQTAHPPVWGSCAGTVLHQVLLCTRG